MPLSAVEHRRVKDATRVARNATARRLRTRFGQAEAWVAAMGATVERWPHGDGMLFRVRVKGFHPQTANTLEAAVEILDAHIADWCASGATLGPTRARLAPLCASREAWEEARRGD